MVIVLKRFSLIIMLALASSIAHAKHLHLNLTKEGVKNLLIPALSLYKDSNGKIQFNLKSLKRKIKAKVPTHKYPLAAEALYEIGGIKLNEEFELDINLVNLEANALVKSQDIKLEVVQTQNNEFLIDLKTQIFNINLATEELQICNKDCKANNLKVKFSNIEINQEENLPIQLSAKFYFSMVDNKAKVKIQNIETNIDQLLAKNQTIIDMMFKTDIPPLAIIINGRERRVDTSAIDTIINTHKKILAREILIQTANYLKSDLEVFLNKYLLSKQVSTQYSTKYEKDLREKILLPTIAQDNTRYVTNARMMDYMEENQERSLQEILTDAIFSQILSSKLGLSLLSAKVENEGLKLQVEPYLKLNSVELVTPELFSKGKYLSGLEYPTFSKIDHDLAVSISEPLINGVIEVAHKNGIIRNIVDHFVGMDGVYVGKQGIKFHIIPKADGATLHAVINLKIVLSDMTSFKDFSWQDIKGAIENFAGDTIEQFTPTGGILYFPLELEIKPEIVKIEEIDYISLKLTSPFDGGSLKNTFNYKTNLNLASNKVRQGVLSKLEKSMEKINTQSMNIPLKNIQNNDVFDFDLKKIEVSNSGHIKIYAKIKDINVKKVLGK